MTVPKDSKKKPKKPEGSPLVVWSNGQWAKQIRGRVYCFGPWDFYEEALERYYREKPYLEKGLAPPSEDGESETLDAIVNMFLAHQQNRLEIGEITQDTYDALHTVGALIVKTINRTREVDTLLPDDFWQLREAITKDRSPVVAKVKMARVRQVFNFALAQGWIESLPKYGRSFDPPTKATIRKHNNKTKKLFTPGEIQSLVNSASVSFLPILLLGLNCGLNNSDIRHLSKTNIKNGWLDYPRHKTGIQRRVPLWDRTLEAISNYEQRRPSVDSDILLITETGRQPWSRYAIGQEFRKIRTVGTYTWLRHTFQTMGDNLTRDFRAVRAIMGHVNDDISSEYIEEISDERLRSVTNALEAWAFKRSDES